MGKLPLLEAFAAKRGLVMAAKIANVITRVYLHARIRTNLKREIML